MMEAGLDSSLKFSSLKLTTVSNDDLCGRLARVGSNAFNLLDNVHALDDGSEDDVLAVEPGGLGGAEEKLGAVGSGASVGH